VETQLVGDFSSVHSVGKILLIGKHKQERVTKFIFVQHTLKFITGF
jgi:hypothetical protein